MKPTIILIFSCLLFLPLRVLGQIAPAQSSIVFTEYVQPMPAKTSPDYIRFSINQNLAAGWKVTVAVTANFVNQSDPSVYIEAQHVAVQFSSVSDNNYIPANTGQIPLSTAPASLIAGVPALNAPPGLDYQFDFIVQGGDHLLVTNGIYKTNLILSVYDNNNQLVTSYNYEVSFQIDVTGNGGLLAPSYTLGLQNGADLITFQFQDVNDYQTNLSITKSAGLKVSVTGILSLLGLLINYDVYVHTLTNNLTSNTTAATIPASTFKLESPGEVPIFLSSTAQVLIHDSITLSLFTINRVYNLIYTVNNVSNLQKPAGTYTTQVFFTLIAN